MSLERHPFAVAARSLTRSARPLLLVAAAATVALAQAAYEGAPSFKASEILPPTLLKGPHFQVKEAVATTGYFHDFDITSDYGDIGAEGRSLLLMRVHEIQALTALDETSKTEVFAKAAGNSVLKVGKGVASVVVDPGGTAKGIGAGVKRFGTNLGRKAKRGAEDVTSDDKKDASQPEKSDEEKAKDAGEGAAKSVLGVNGAYRRWAQKLRVDPYTSNPVLKKALTDIAKIDAAGGIAAKVVVPIPMVVGTTASVGQMVWGKDPEALLKMNEENVKALGTPEKEAKAFFRNKAFTLGYQTRFITALSAVKVKGCGDYVDTAEAAQNERQVVFFTESAELLQRFHAKTPVSEILPDSRAVVAKTADGRAVILLAVDFIRWSADFEKNLTEIIGRSKTELKASRVELQMTGFASPGARQQLKTLGVTLVEKVPGTFPDPQPTAASAKKS